MYTCTSNAVKENFLERSETCDIYESSDERESDIFLFMAKVSIVSTLLDIKYGSKLLYRSKLLYNI